MAKELKVGKVYINTKTNKPVMIISRGYYGYSTAMVKDLESKEQYTVNIHYLDEAPCYESPLCKAMDEDDDSEV